MMWLEFVYALKVVKKIHASLTLINKTIRGIIVPDRKVMETIGSLQSHQTPDIWQDFWSGPRNPVEYLSTLIYKAKSVQELVSLSKKIDFRQSTINFSKLFRPVRLLNALRQLTARTKGCTMDMLRLSSAWDTALLAQEITIQVDVCEMFSFHNEISKVLGIFLQGALFDGQLRDTLVSSPPITSAPQLTLGWTKIDSQPTYKESQCVSVPLYNDLTRSDHIATVMMPCADVHKWNIAAVALFLK
ncbi:hypothetical protein DICVIV_07087 [Dictyocaulus viviparus]|uniref:Dynein heavy chain C-terminal domain-containing protein n=1 Tax=Dictyocaulus viviparus TaxID=29172 RepID=A0A0D8XQR9_DICVI|nr:hypothetical protein DICVIV_07087 [Dictyocaulus viviparus]